VASPKTLPEGKVTVRYAFKYDGGGLGKGGTGTIFINCEKVAVGKIEKTQPLIFSADEGADVGQDGETNVTNDYKEGNNKFTGQIRKVIVELK
jgi:arylsulfatase